MTHEELLAKNDFQETLEWCANEIEFRIKQNCLKQWHEEVWDGRDEYAELCENCLKALDLIRKAVNE